jgi:homoserine kinase
VIRHHGVRVPATSANLGPGFDAFGLALAEGGVAGVGIGSFVVRSVPAAGAATRITTTGAGAGEVPDGDDNLVWRSVVAFCDTYDAPVPDVALHATSHIPLERGLGSSSGAIVAGLVLARALTDVVVGDRWLVELATQLEGHPDNVAPALLGGLVACTEDDAGELVVRRINPAPSLAPVVLVPPARQATHAARAVLPTELSRSDAVLQASRAGHVLGAFAGLWPAAAEAAGDLLHEPARATAMPATGGALTALRTAGVHAWLSGAGPSVAALVPERDHDAVDTVRVVAADHGFEVHRLTVDLAGAVACPEEGCAISGGGGCTCCPRRSV